MVTRTPPPVVDAPDRLIGIGALVIAGGHALVAVWLYGLMHDLPFTPISHVVDLVLVGGAIALFVGWTRCVNSPSSELRILSTIGIIVSVGFVLSNGVGLLGGGGGMFALAKLGSIVEAAAVVLVVVAASVYRAQTDTRRSPLVVLSWIATAASVFSSVVRPTEDFSWLSLVICYGVLAVLPWLFAGLLLLLPPRGIEQVPTATVIHR